MHIRHPNFFSSYTQGPLKNFKAIILTSIEHLSFERIFLMSISSLLNIINILNCLNYINTKMALPIYFLVTKFNLVKRIGT